MTITTSNIIINFFIKNINHKIYPPMNMIFKIRPYIKLLYRILQSVYIYYSLEISSVSISKKIDIPK